MPILKDLDLKATSIRMNKGTFEKLCEISREYSIQVSVICRKAIGDYVEAEYINLMNRRKARTDVGMEE